MKTGKYSFTDGWNVEHISEQLQLFDEKGNTITEGEYPHYHLAIIDMTVQWQSGIPFAVALLPVAAMKRFVEEFEKKHGHIETY